MSPSKCYSIRTRSESSIARMAGIGRMFSRYLELFLFFILFWNQIANLVFVADIDGSILSDHHRFIVQIEKEWLSFGHKFNERNGFVLSKQEQRSPIFLQYLECVWQIQQQFPSEFEFTEGLIARLCDHSHSNWFGNFLHDSPKQREERGVTLNTVSLWSWPIARNNKYDPKLKLLKANVRGLQPVFDAYFQRFDEIYHLLSLQSKQNEDEEEEEKEAEHKKPQWVEGKGCSVCHECQSRFTLFRRKHHCRSCGQIFCDECSKQSIALKHFGYDDPVRVCADCFELNT